ncbi:hypothetical protein [Nonomuraea sp. NPDC001023]|uniref:hypothetical protein n=1 Tax=unclassified Nonomuraea TaxID=2593643 RepID=UPI0033341CCE
MTLLEQRYRFILKMLPAFYRAEREEEMVEAFLQGAGPDDDGHSARPSWGEVASIAALAIRIRLGGIGAAPRSRAVGDAVRLAALLGLGYQAAISWITIVFSLRALGYRPGQSPLIAPGGQASELVSIVESLVWIAAFAALTLGKVRAAKLLGGLGLTYVLVMLGIDILTWPRSVIDSGPYVLVIVVPVAALLTAYHRDAPVRRSPQLSALPLSLAAIYIAIALAFTNAWGTAAAPSQPTMWIAGWIDPHSVTAAALLIAGLLSLTRKTRPAWRLALAVVALPIAAARSPLFLLGAAGPMQPYTITLIIQCSALLILCLVLTVASLRALPRPVQLPLRGRN